MRRREFITLLGGMAVAWPIEARAQEPARIKRIGVLLASADDDLDTQAHAAVFVQQLQQSGWIDGRNIRLEIRWGAGNATNEQIRRGIARARAGRYLCYWRRALSFATSGDPYRADRICNRP